MLPRPARAADAAAADRGDGFCRHRLSSIDRDRLPARPLPSVLN